MLQSIKSAAIPTLAIIAVLLAVGVIQPGPRSPITKPLI
jgi:hypothetical protein